MTWCRFDCGQSFMPVLWYHRLLSGFLANDQFPWVSHLFDNKVKPGNLALYGWGKPRKTSDRRAPEGCPASHRLKWDLLLPKDLGRIVQHFWEREKEREVRKKRRKEYKRPYLCFTVSIKTHCPPFVCGMLHKMLEFVAYFAPVISCIPNSMFPRNVRFSQWFVL